MQSCCDMRMFRGRKMADILYTYKNNVYVNLTNKCDCACTFCIRSHRDSVGEADTLWHKRDPELREVLDALDAFDFSGYEELVYCGYGEPTCALDILTASAKYAKEKYGIRVRVNTNGLANLYYGRDVVPELAEVADCVSISMNAPTAEEYMAVTRPKFDGAFEAMLQFASECAKHIEKVQFTVVDVLSEDDIEASRRLAASMGIGFRVRHYA